MNLHHLKIFYVVAEAGSISLGAERLFISQPAVTREIRELELTLGVTLFDRLSRGVTLTEAGQRLVQFASRIFILEHAAEMEMRAFAGLTAGKLTLGASTTVGAYFLPQWLSAFHCAHPAIDVSLLIANTASVEAKVLEHDITLGFVEGPFNTLSFASVLIGHDAIIAVTHAKHALATQETISAAELTENKVIMREPGSGTRATIEKAYRALNLSIRPALSVGSTEAIKQLLLTGNGIAWLSEQAVRYELQAGTLIRLPINDLVIKRPLHMIWHKEQKLNPSASAFHSLILEDLQH